MNWRLLKKRCFGCQSLVGLSPNIISKSFTIDFMLCQMLWRAGAAYGEGCMLLSLQRSSSGTSCGSSVLVQKGLRLVTRRLKNHPSDNELAWRQFFSTDASSSLPLSFPWCSLMLSAHGNTSYKLGPTSYRYCQDFYLSGVGKARSVSVLCYHSSMCLTSLPSSVLASNALYWREVEW